MLLEMMNMGCFLMSVFILLFVVMVIRGVCVTQTHQNVHLKYMQIFVY